VRRRVPSVFFFARKRLPALLCVGVAHIARPVFLGSAFSGAGSEDEVQRRFYRNLNKRCHYSAMSRNV
jgi:hypothetical protein